MDPQGAGIRKRFDRTEVLVVERRVAEGSHANPRQNGFKVPRHLHTSAFPELQQLTRDPTMDYSLRSTA